jgi:hypothetical protein
MRPVLSVIWRILEDSVKKMFPDLSMASLFGDASLALDAAIPLNVRSLPFPATVVMMPVLTVTFLMRLNPSVK